MREELEADYGRYLKEHRPEFMRCQPWPCYTARMVEDYRQRMSRIWRLSNLPFTDNDRRAIQHEALTVLGVMGDVPDTPREGETK